MERLTKRINGVVTYIGEENSYDTGQIAAELNAAARREILERLADYEDTKRRPEEVQALNRLFDYALTESRTLQEQLALIERLRELAEADKDGRVVVLPCKVGDTVWIIKQTFESSHFEPRGFLLQDAFNIDKTVFLTCAEAKKALEGRKLQGIKVYLSGKITGEGGQPWTD